MVSVRSRSHALGLLPLALVAACTAAAPASHATHIRGDRYVDEPHAIVPTSEPPCGSTLDQDGDGKTDITTQYTYDARGRQIGAIVVDARGVQVRQEELTYDNAGHVVDERVTEPGATRRTLSTFDPLGHLTHTDTSIVRPPPLGDATIFTSYGPIGDDWGVLEVTTPVGGARREILRVYTLDDLGRWINRDITVDGVPSSSERAVFDDDARTVTFTLRTKPTPQHPVGEDFTAVDIYDTDYNYAGSHSTDVLSDGTSDTRDDMIVRDATREIYETTTDTRTSVDQATGARTTVVTTANLTYSFTGCR
jgi:hypothetical protein